MKKTIRYTFLWVAMAIAIFVLYKFLYIAHQTAVLGCNDKMFRMIHSKLKKAIDNEEFSSLERLSNELEDIISSDPTCEYAVNKLMQSSGNRVPETN